MKAKDIIHAAHAAGLDSRRTADGHVLILARGHGVVAKLRAHGGRHAEEGRCLRNVAAELAKHGCEIRPGR